MAKVAFTAQAKRDLAGIADFIARDDPDRAVSFTLELRDACEALAVFPRAYPVIRRFGANAHKRSLGDYLIIYDVVGSSVTIRFIVHGARNLDALP